MEQSLVITEKPSVALSISKVIGATTKKDGYYEGNGYKVSWCIGHLVQMANPDAYDEKYAKWNMADLPIIPKDYKYEVAKSTNKQFAILKKLMNDKDADTVINACDAGREGEAIFRLVYNQVNCKKKMKRLWISSMEDSAIKEGFKNLKDGKDYDNLFESSQARAIADWLVGMNMSRLYSLLYNQNYSVGRVQTPTLAMIVQRNNEIANFKKEKYYTVELDLGGFILSTDRIDNKKKAEELKEFVGDKIKITDVIKKEKSIKKLSIYINRLEDIINIKGNTQKGLKLLKIDSINSIMFNNTIFSYEKENKILFRLSAIFNKGDLVIVSGENGTGKSSFLKKIFRYVDCSLGQMFINETDITTIDINSIRNKIAYVPQDVFLFDESIKDNITLGREMNAEEIKNVFNKVSMNEFIGKLNTGYDYKIQNSGVNISGGEKKKLALSRLYCTSFDVILLDEPFSGVDVESKEHIISNIFNDFRDKIIFIVTHDEYVKDRLSNIYNLSDGNITIDGNDTIKIKCYRKNEKI